MSAALLVLSVAQLSAQTPPAAGAPAAEGQKPDAEQLKEGERKAVIPGGQEAVLSEIVGKGTPLAGCTLAAGSVSGATLQATYDCPTGQVVLQLMHPSVAPAAAVKTERFAIVTQSGTPPEALVNELATRVRANEARFEWKWLEGPRPHTSSPLGSIPPLAVAAVAAVIALAAWLFFRRRSA